jgi:hypothetical protein
MTNQALRFVGFAATLLVLSVPAYADDRDEATGATGVTLYEIGERVTFDQQQGVIVRNATSPLQGFAAVGTPLCPSVLLISVPRIRSCTVIAIGTDSVSTVTGTGPVSGTFDVVINAPGNSSIHVPDLAVNQRDVQRRRRPVARRSSPCTARLDHGHLHDHADRRSCDRNAGRSPAADRPALQRNIPHALQARRTGPVRAERARPRRLLPG